MATIHFLLVYDLNKRHLISRDEFSDADVAAAEYASMEEKHRGNKDLEIVLVGADSLETIMMTHRQYFSATSPGTASQFLTGV